MIKTYNIHLVILLVALTGNFLVHSQVTNPERYDKRWVTDTSNRIASLTEFQALMPRDGFQVFDNPAFLDKSTGIKSYYEHEPVISVVLNGEAKAYPLNILTYHELANDEVGRVPVLVSYCPLCNSGLVFDRRLKTAESEYLLDFGVSGMLRKSDMVMWDRQTESWWQQISGQSLVGQLAGSELELIPSTIISVKEFFDIYPEGLILSNKTGNKQLESERYGTNVYVGYDSKEEPSKKFYNEELDSRLPAMERVIHIGGDSEYRIYPFSVIRKKGVINDAFHGNRVVIFYKKGVVSVLDKHEINQSKDVGAATVFIPIIDGQHLTFRKKNDQFIDEQTGSLWNIAGQCVSGPLQGEQLMIEPHGQHFAFAWLTFYPDSEIYQE